MAILKRLMNIAFLTLIATFMVMASLVSASAYSKKAECEADEARSVMYANPKALAAACAKMTKEECEMAEMLRLSVPIGCLGGEHGWQRNFYMGLVLYSALTLTALLILLALNYVVFGHVTVWHRGVMERK